MKGYYGKKLATVYSFAAITAVLPSSEAGIGP